MLQSDKYRLHSSVQNYVKNILSVNTQKWHIRIDEITDLSYRYTAWEKNKQLSQKPDFVLYGGTLGSIILLARDKAIEVAYGKKTKT
jgi:hypothetical protein